jgi:hypothetical protein
MRRYKYGQSRQDLVDWSIFYAGINKLAETLLQRAKLGQPLL